MFSILPTVILFFLIQISLQISRDMSSFSNSDQIIQTHMELGFYLDFDTKTVSGQSKILFKALKDGNLIILDTKYLAIKSVIDVNRRVMIDWKLDTDQAIDSLGTPLIIKLYTPYLKGETVGLLIQYSTTQPLAPQWLAPEMTSGRVYPFMYTQCEAIMCRSLLPCQDTPSVKAPVYVNITVKKPLVAVFSGVYKSKLENDLTVTYFYEQKIPIPTYLIAMAAGAIEGRKISDRTTIYAEKELVDKAAKEFSDIEQYLEIAENYLTPYEWGVYNILVLPMGFPYGGMENPTLTFVTSSILAGDKSMASVIIHEIGHSWTGNLVTMSDWTNFWLNEGFTTFIERKIIERLEGLDMAKLYAQERYHNLLLDIQKIGESHSFTSLQPDIQHHDPDESFSAVPYEKGFNFLYYLQNLTNVDNKDFFRLILKDYVNKFKFQSINYIMFKEHFEYQVKRLFNETLSRKILSQVDWNSWMFKPGRPIIENDFRNKYSIEVAKDVEDLFNDTIKDEFVEKFRHQWHTIVKLLFLNEILEDPRGTNLTDKQYRFLNYSLGLNDGYNVEVEFTWYHIMLRNQKTDNLDYVLGFLGNVGRITYIRPIYHAWALFDKKSAYQAFNRLKSKYHPVAVRLILEDFNQLP